MQVLKLCIVPVGLNKCTDRSDAYAGIVQRPHTPVSIHLFSDSQSPS